MGCFTYLEVAYRSIDASNYKNDQSYIKKMDLDELTNAQKSCSRLGATTVAISTLVFFKCGTNPAPFCLYSHFLNTMTNIIQNLTI